MVKLIQKQVIADQGSHPAFKDVKAWYDSKLHPDVINENDESVYDCYGEGKFAGLFQFTASGAQKFIQRIKPKNIIDIATATSIYRPGPLAAKVDDIYQQAKEAPHKIEYEHPLTKQVLEQTFNCVIFQEQLMQVANIVGGLSLEECDKLRKVITKRSVSGASKAKEDALKLEKKFIEGAVKNGLTEEGAKALFEKLSFFSGYGFNKSLQGTDKINTYDANGEFKVEKIIENIQKNDYIKSKDEKTGKEIYIPVVDKHDHGVLELFEFELDDGRTIRCTKNHKFRTVDGRMLPIIQIFNENIDLDTE